MFGLFKSKKPFIQDKIEDIVARKPYLKEAIKNNVKIKNDIYLFLDEKIRSGDTNESVGLALIAHLPFFVGYIADQLDGTIFFRKSDAIETLLMLQYTSYPHLDERQTNMMERMCSELADSAFYKAGQNYSKNFKQENVVTYFMSVCEESLSEIKEILRRNS